MVKSIEDIQLYFKNRQSFGIKPGLERMDLLLKKLNNPERKIRTIHVAGTNGKGSTVNMIAQALIANGYRVGVFSSPSFSGITGHFLINHDAITEHDLILLMNKIIPIVKEMDEIDESPTEFEIITALAFLYFYQRVDIAIVETGMGGRYDTTNCVSPIVSIITSLGLDHEHFLGETIQEIACHKAGIIKEGKPVIVGPVHEAATSVIDREAKEKKAPVILYNNDFHVVNGEGYFIWKGPHGDRYTLTLRLKGKHQTENAALALMAVSYLHNELNFNIDWDKVIQAIEKVKLPGRFEQIVDNPTIIVDSAHNIAGVEAFIQTAKTYTDGAKATLLFAGFHDKRLEEMVDRLLDASFTVSLTTFQHERAAQQHDFENILKSHPKLMFYDNWKEVLTEYIKKQPGDDLLFITGSLHFVMLVRQFIKENGIADNII